MRPPRGYRPWLWALGGALAGPVIAGLVLFLLVAVSVSSSILDSRGASGGVDEFPALKETWSYGDGKVKAARIPLKGIIIEEEGGGWFAAPGPVETALRQIRAATEDEDVYAIILEIDSPGGGVTASDLIYKALMDFKARSPDRKVIALFGDMATSGAYYVATAADHIIAQPTAMTGSFSVLISGLNVKKLGDDYGVKMETIKSGKNKDILSPFSNMSDEQRAILQGVVDDMHNRFVELIVKARTNMPAEAVQQITDGRVFTAAKAMEYKIVDQIGYWEDAVAKAGEMLAEDEVKIIRYSEEFSLSAFLAGSHRGRLSAVGLLDRFMRVRVESMWQL